MASKTQTLMHSPLNATFGLTIDNIVPVCQGSGRFSAWLNSNPDKVRNLLKVVESAGVSPALFAAYEMNEGYNASWGWLNHTYPQGNATQDAKAVCAWMVQGSKNMSGSPAWDDPGGGTVGVVPADVIAKGNADFATLPSGSIGRLYIAGTAAATWATYYPQALNASVNGVQNYGDPFADAIATIERMGGKIDGKGGTTPAPTQPDKPATDNPAKPAPKPTPPVAPKGATKPYVLISSMAYQLETDNVMTRFGDYLYLKDEKKDENGNNAKPNNNNTSSKENNNQDVKNNNNDKPAPKPDGNLDFAWLNSLQGVGVGSGQCYALAEAWAVHCGIPVGVLNGTTAQRWGNIPEPSVGVAWGAVNIGHDFPWDKWGWTVIDNPKIDDLRAGDIVCIFSDHAGGWSPPVGGVRYGHVVICGEKSGGITTLWEQNGTAGMVCAKQPATSGAPTMETYANGGGLASMIRKGK